MCLHVLQGRLDSRFVFCIHFRVFSSEEASKFLVVFLVRLADTIECVRCFFEASVGCRASPDLEQAPTLFAPVLRPYRLFNFSIVCGRGAVVTERRCLCEDACSSPVIVTICV